MATNCDTTVIEVGSCQPGEIIDNENGTHTFDPGDGATVTFPTKYLASATFNTTTRDLSLTLSEGTIYTVNIPAAPVIVDNLDETYTITYPDGTTFDIDTNDTVTTLVNNANGTITYTDEDGVTTDLDICNLIGYCEISALGNVNAAPDANNIFLVYNTGTGEWEEGKANLVTISDQTGSAYNHLSLPSAPVSPPASPNINDVIIEVFNNGQIFWRWAGATWNRYYESYPTNSPTFTGTANVNAGVVTNDWEINGDLIVDVIRPDIDGASAIAIADQSGVPFWEFDTSNQRTNYVGMGSVSGISLGLTGVVSNLQNAIIIGENALGGTGTLFDGASTVDSNSIIIGVEAAENSRVDANSIVIGFRTFENGSGPISSSVAIGGNAGATSTDTTPTNFVAVGYNAGQAATELSDNVMVGYAAGQTNEGNSSVFVGRNAGLGNTGNNTAFIGRGAGEGSSGFANIGIGYQAGIRSTGNYNVAIGYQALEDVPSGSNIGIGFRALHDSIDTTGNNVAIGTSALDASNSSDSVAIGASTAVSAVSDSLVAIGRNSLNGAISAYATTAIGRDSGVGIDADYTTAIGFYAGRNAVGDRSVYLGAYQGFTNAISSKLLIGAYDGVPIIEGDMSGTIASQILTLHADTTVNYNLDVVEDFTVATDLFAVDTTADLVSITASNASSTDALRIESSYANVRILGTGGSNLWLERNQNSSNDYALFFMKRRGDMLTPADIVNGDNLGVIKFGARYSGGVEAEFATIQAISGTGGSREGRLEFNVSNGGAPITKFRLNEFGKVGIGQGIADSNAALLVSANYSGEPVGISASCIGLFTRQNSAAYIAVSADTTATASIFFGDVDDINAGYIEHNNNDGIMTFGAESNFYFAEPIVAGTTNTAPLSSGVHVNIGTFNSTPTGINTSQVGFLLTRQTSACGIAINSSVTSDAYLYFGDENDVNASVIIHSNDTGRLRIRAESEIEVDSITDYTVAMGNSALDPTTDAPADWVEIQIGGTTYYVPAYAAA